jgi:hypothetical protein
VPGDKEERERWTLLAELGRVRGQRGEAAFWSAVEWVMEHRLPVKVGVRMLRSARLGMPPREDSLEPELLKVLRPYPASRTI